MCIRDRITVDVNILTMLKQAASCLTEAAGRDVYLAAIGPDMELTIIMEDVYKRQTSPAT